ncbi:hypothetical protein NWP21_03150 [Anabaenopsis sp. FSS-46]|uniref:hypothetical protein n=1 Tax=Anabaenopsis sp. FSS-46 TaxID=2971766 RepID=UPI0024759FEC|nr:hypothetical protein [Anabaenopsis sp. FSS-46]MDH6097856.1 hypothetical protein [Anabaenopsis sp. FSS-46]
MRKIFQALVLGSILCNYCFAFKPVFANEDTKNPIPKGYVAPVFGVDRGSNSAFGIHGRIFQESPFSNRFTLFFPEGGVVSTNAITYDLPVGATSNIYTGVGLYGSSVRNSLEFLVQFGGEIEVGNNIILFSDYSLVLTGEDGIRNEGILKFGVGLGL